MPAKKTATKGPTKTELDKEVAKLKRANSKLNLENEELKKELGVTQAKAGIANSPGVMHPETDEERKKREAKGGR